MAQQRQMLNIHYRVGGPGVGGADGYDLWEPAPLAGGSRTAPLMLKIDVKFLCKML